MDFNYKELSRLNEMISIAFLSGKVAYDETSKLVHRKITNEILKRNQNQKIGGMAVDDYFEN